MNITENTLVWIKWRDAVGTWSRFDSESLASLSLVINTNIGWVAHENDERVVLVAGLSTSGEVDALVIAKHDIVERIPVDGKKIQNNTSKAF